MAAPTGPGAEPHLPLGVTAREARLVLRALGQVKGRRFGRLLVVVSDGQLVDIEIVEKIDHAVLRTLGAERGSDP